MLSLQQGLEDLQKTAHETKAELKRLSHDTNEQLVHLQHSVATMQAKVSSALDDSFSKTSVHGTQHRHQRARVSTDYMPVLARNEVLDTVFSFVGTGDYYYVAAVCRNWRGRYMQLCAQTASSMKQRFSTSLKSVLVSADRLQLALDNGLSVETLQKKEYSLAITISKNSLEPIAVLSLARVYGLPWNIHLPFYAVQNRQYELLRWLRKCGCPWDLELIILDADDNGDLDHMKQMRAITGPWPVDRLKDMLRWAGSCDELDNLKWLHEQGKVWPTSFCDFEAAPDSRCWSLRCVQWAVANGSTWLVWRCQDLALENYSCCSDGTEHSDETCYLNCDRKHAHEVFVWAHENGCPCTCNEPVAAAAV
jgi:hypothetical protein